MLYYLWRVLCGTHLDHPGVYHRRVRRVILSSNQSVPVQLDGDPAGFLSPVEHGRGAGERAATEPACNWTIEVIPAAVDVLVPASKVTRDIAAVPLARSRAVR